MRGWMLRAEVGVLDFKLYIIVLEPIQDEDLSLKDAQMSSYVVVLLPNIAPN